VASPPDFYDRKAEIQLFRKLLAGSVSYRVLAYLVGPQKGKTYLMRHLLDHCKEKRMAAALIDFDTRQREVVSYWKFVHRLCDALGWEHFPEVRECSKKHDTVLPALQIHTGSGQAGTHFGSKGHFEEADFDQIVGRDLTQVYFTYQESQGKSESRQEKLKYEMGRALQSGLARMSSENRVVLLLDTFERVYVETLKWIDEWIFECLLDHYPNLVIVIAGLPQIHDYLSQAGPWTAVMHVREEFALPDANDVRELFKKQGIFLTEDQIRNAVKYARYKISLLTDMAKAHMRYPDE
jgi:hypothetical protein